MGKSILGGFLKEFSCPWTDCKVTVLIIRRLSRGSAPGRYIMARRAMS